MTEMHTNKHGFEIETCGRCGGSGEYSFNLLDGKRCYGCQGKGVKFTKRGRAAYDFCSKGFTVKWSEVEPGQKVFESGGWRTVTDIADAIDKYPGGIYVSFGPDFGLFTSKDFEVKVFHKMESARLAAIEYQATLTKAGKPRKR
jgi:hypothetical protein